jgi:hypothetical protein
MDKIKVRQYVSIKYCEQIWNGWDSPIVPNSAADPDLDLKEKKTCWIRYLFPQEAFNKISNLNILQILYIARFGS